MAKTNLEQALDSIKRIGSFSEGEKIALVKGLRQALFPGNWSISNPSDDDIVQYNSTTELWHNAQLPPDPTYTFTDLTDTPSTLSGSTKLYARVNTGETALEFDTVAVADLEDMLLTAHTTGDVLGWNGSNYTNLTLSLEDFTPTSTKGDLLVDNGSAVTFLGVGADDYVLTADSTEATGVKWAAVTTPAVEGTAVLSTGETVGKVLQADGDNSCSWVTIPGGGDALTTNPLSQFAATTSAQLAGVISDETGSGALVFATSPTLVTPALGTPASGDLSNCTGYDMTDIDTTGGSSNQVYVANGSGGGSWTNQSAGFSDPMTTRGDIIIRDATNTTARLGLGTSGQVLTSDGTDLSWEDAAAGSTFISLTDTPANWTSSAGKNVRVNDAGTALIFDDAAVTSVTGTAPVVSSGGTTPAISMPAATSSVDGYATSTQITKLDGIENLADVTDAANVADAVEAFGAGSAVSGTDDFAMIQGSTAKRVDMGLVETYLNANLNFNNYSHPSYNGDDFSVDTGPLTGATVVSDIDINVTTDSSGHVTDANGTVSTRTLTAADISAATADHGHSDLGALDSTPTFSGQCAAASFKATSAREKKNIIGGEEAIWTQGLAQLKPVVYTLKDDDSGEQQLGLIADEVQQLFPEICGFDENGKANSVDYSRLVIPLLLKVRELEARLDG